MRSSPSKARVSVLLPAYQLGNTIADSVERVRKALASLPDVEIVVCDDGSSDGTWEAICDAASADDDVIATKHVHNAGKGAAIRTAFAASTGDVVVMLDADMDIPPEQVPGFLDTFERRDVDGLVGDKSGAMDNHSYSRLRIVLSRSYSWVIRRLFSLPVDETQTGLKVFRRGALADILPGLETDRYTFDIELLAKLHRRGFTLGSAPIELADGAGATALSVLTLVGMARDTVRIRWQMRRWPTAR